MSDTTPEAAAFQLELYRKLGPAKRCEIAAKMSVAARAIALAGIRSRHPGYDEQQARWALFRLLVGEPLFRKVWPAAPVLEP